MEFVTVTPTTLSSVCLTCGHHAKMCSVKDSPVCVHCAQPYLTYPHSCMECESDPISQYSHTKSRCYNYLANGLNTENTVTHKACPS